MFLWIITSDTFRPQFLDIFKVLKIDLPEDGQELRTKHVQTIINKHNEQQDCINPLNAELNFIWHLLTLLEAHHILHVSRIRVK